MDNLPSTLSAAKALGALYYYTGKPCKHGHVDKRLTSNGLCATCKREIDRKYREENREKQREYSRKWRTENPEKNREATRQWKKANREKIQEGKRKRYAANPEKYREARRKRHAANPEKERERDRQRDKKNPEKHRERKRRREALKRSVPYEKQPPGFWEGLQEEQNHICPHTNVPYEFVGFEMDHVFAISQGGTERLRNFQPLSPQANGSKNNKLLFHIVTVPQDPDDDQPRWIIGTVYADTQKDLQYRAEEMLNSARK